MACYVFFDVKEVRDPEGMGRYQQGVLATVLQYGGRYVVVGGKKEVVEGDWEPTFPVLITFPSMERAKAWYGSEEYRDLLALRLASTSGNAVMMESEPSPFITE